MRKIVAVIACTFAIGAFQAHKAEAQTIGFKVGPTWSKVDVDPEEAGDTEDMLSSFGGGGFVRFGSGALKLQAEVLALTKGSRSEDPESDANVELELDYIEVPLLAVFSLGKGPYVFAGPSFGFEIGCEAQLNFEGAELSADCDEGDEEEVFERKKFDIGVTGGLGFELPVGPGALLIEGRYTHGLSNLNDSPNNDTKIRNRSFAAMAGYSISLGR